MNKIYTASEVWDILHTPESPELPELRFMADNTWTFSRALPVGVFQQCWDGNCCDDTEADRESFIQAFKDYDFELQP